MVVALCGKHCLVATLVLPAWALGHELLKLASQHGVLIELLCGKAG